jgi:2-polyprenyl-3-methyl-5-hydroxy-6-metoxy-1,4-benzoquinol methylase
MVSFQCNICGQDNTVAALGHEASSCAGCGSSVRLRALVYTLAMELFGEGLPLPEFPNLPAVKGLGLSDQVSYAAILGGKFDYTNTFYDREPRIDITEPHPDLHGTYDFILSSDVFEHISVPVERAFDEAYKLLKPHGVLCLTTPFSLQEETAEHFPDLHDYTIVSLSGAPVLVNRKKDGTLEVRDDLVFHGGAGATLEMRLFSRKDLERKLRAADFEAVVFQTEGVPRFGIAFEGDWSLPLVARKGEFVFNRQAAGQLVREFCARSAELTELRKQCADLTSRLDLRGSKSKTGRRIGGARRLGAQAPGRSSGGRPKSGPPASGIRRAHPLGAAIEKRPRTRSTRSRRAAVKAGRAAATTPPSPIPAGSSSATNSAPDQN